MERLNHMHGGKKINMELVGWLVRQEMEVEMGRKLEKMRT